MASQTQGIQQLLTAEKRAAEKVAEARKRNYQFNVENFSFLLILLIIFSQMRESMCKNREKESAFLQFIPSLLWWWWLFFIFPKDFSSFLVLNT